MPYSTKDDVETWSQTNSSDLGSVGYDYDNTIQYLINVADRAIDDETNQPEGFFTSGGIEIEKEHHDGVEVGHYGFVVRFYGYSKRPFLRLKYTPVLSVTKLEEETSADTWTTRTEGRDNDYLVMETGVRFLRNIPKYRYKNMRVTYKTGYVATPGRISECSARLAAAMAHRIFDSKNRGNVAVGGLSVGKPAEFVGLAKSCFTDDLKDLVKHYRRRNPVRLS